MRKTHRPFSYTYLLTCRTAFDFFVKYNHSGLFKVPPQSGTYKTQNKQFRDVKLFFFGQRGPKWSDPKKKNVLFNSKNLNNPFINYIQITHFLKEHEICYYEIKKKINWEISVKKIKKKPAKFQLIISFDDSGKKFFNFI
ncbi:hypothetical protein BpHYR1_013868 [Brachionus plicatilis]|uniref:Uncharacterized protein n=1 Tax=Brachionus plicatilis TaxID=10195 RepID=A0A3M7SAR7_BRAPC|nr:hypothetical protein BpHYR1_013868 [Brachionus plicatilis]